MDYLETTFVISAHRLDQLPTDELPEIAFAGRSNVGKSSLLNTLLNRKQLAKVSSRPGKTTGLNFFLVQQSL
ncbi:MAG: GTPase, partial [Desulfofustis sp.]|nr:GTPase [Desulfofustis sp.]